MSRLLLILPLLAAVFLAFVGGIAAMHFGVGVPQALKTAYDELVMATSELGYQPERGWLFIGAKTEDIEDWNNPPAPDWEPGLKVLDNARVQAGYTLYSTFYEDLPIKLIDMDGNTVHEWRLPEAFNNGKRLDSRKFSPDVRPLAGDKHLYPDGRLLVNFNHSFGYPPWGMGIAMLDKDSKVLWTYMKSMHHTMDVGEDGRILGMLHRYVGKSVEGLENIEPPFQSEELVVLSPEGKQLQVVSIYRALANSPWTSVLQYGEPEASGGDIMHSNAARFITAEQARHIPNAEEGDVLVSLRDLNTLIVMDLDEETVKWAVRGPWHMQHDPWILENGNIILYDNRGDLANGGHSRIIEFDPETLAIEWEFPGELDFDLYSPICGSVSRLDNGNTLITESNRGRLLEVTREGEVVWEFVIPERAEYARYLTTKALHARRIDPATLDFIER